MMPTEKGLITITHLGQNKEPAKQDGVGQSVVTSVSVISDQLVIAGENLDGVTKVRITGPSGFDQTFAIESQSASNLVANGLSNIAFAVGSVFDLILTDAQGAATHQVTFNLQDGAVTASKLDDMGAGVGQVLRYDGSTWGPSDLGALTYAGTWDSNSGVPNVSPAAGEYYIVSVAGTGIDLSDGSGSRNFAVGDWLVYNNVTSRWDKIDNATNVTSFNGRNGPITPATNDYTWAQIDKTSSPIGDLSNVNTTGAGVGSVLKFDGTNWVVGTDDTAGAGSVDSSAIADGSIVDADVNASANIAQSKINNLTTDLAAKVPLAGGTMTGDLTVPNLITSGNVDGVDVSALNTTVGNNSTAIAGKQNTITTGTTAQYLRGDLSLSTFATDARSAAVLNSTAGSQTDQAASVAAMKSYVSSQVSGSGSVLDGGNTTGATVVVGTNDAQSLQLETNNTAAMTILSNGNVGIGSATPTATLDVNSISSLSSGTAVTQRVFSRTTQSGTASMYGLKIDTSLGSVGGGGYKGFAITQVGGTSPGEIFSVGTEGNTYVHGRMGIGIASSNRLLEVAGPVRVTATALPGSPTAGDIAVDSGDANKLKWYDGSSWQEAGGSGGGGGTITSVTGTAPIVSSGGTTPAISIAQANGSTNGYLSSTDWTTFNSKQASITTGATTQYLRGDLSLATLQDDVRATLLTGFSSGAGTVAATDTMLQAINKLDGNIAAKQNAITTGTTAQYLRGDLSLSTFATDARTAAVVNSTAGSETNQAASVAAMKSYVAANAGAGDITDGGNSTGSAVIIGTNDAQSLQLETNNSPAMTILNGGNVGVGTTSPTRLLHVNGPIRLTASALPGSPATGDIAVDSGDSNKLKYYNGSSWVSLVTSSGTTYTDLTLMEPYVVSTQATVAHGQGSLPKNVIWYLENTTTDMGYSPGDRVYQLADDAGTRGFSIFADGSNVGVSTENTIPSIMSKNSSSVNNFTATRWKLGAMILHSGTGSGAFTNSGLTAHYTGGNVGIGTTTPARLLHVNGPMRLTASALPSSPAAGDLAVDSGDSNKLKYYDGSSWQSAGGSSSGGNITSCPAGMSMVGDSGKRATYCIDTNERSGTSYFGAMDTCRGVNDSSLGRAHLCSLQEWYNACSLSAMNSRTDDWELVDAIGGGAVASSVYVIGFAGCGETDTTTFTGGGGGGGSFNVFRCCLR